MKLDEVLLLHRIFLSWMSSFYLLKIFVPQSPIVFHVTQSGGGVCVSICTHLCTAEHRKPIVGQTRNNTADCFPTDKEGLVPHSESGPIYCLWLQKSGKRSPWKRECSLLSWQQISYSHYKERNERKKNMEYIFSYTKTASIKEWQSGYIQLTREGF